METINVSVENTMEALKERSEKELSESIGEIIEKAKNTEVELPEENKED